MIETEEQAQQALLKWKETIRAIYTPQSTPSGELLAWMRAFEQGLATARLLGPIDERETARAIAIRALAERGID